MPAWRNPHDSHATFHVGKRDALLAAIVLGVLAFVLQLFGAWYTASLALLGDTAHLAIDLFSLVMSLAAVVLASKPATQGRSFGFYRLEVLASFVNGLLLLAVALGLARESLGRLWAPEPVKVTPLIVVASVGLAFNLISAWVLHKAAIPHEHGGNHQHEHEHQHQHQNQNQPFQPLDAGAPLLQKASCGHDHSQDAALHADRNMHSALLHVLSDAANSLAVIVGGVVMAYTGYFWVDAAVGLGIALWILRWSWRVILDSAHVLLESTPRHVKEEAVIAELRALDARVRGVDDLHVWELTSRMYAATAEVRVHEMSLAESEKLRCRMHDMLHERFGIAHVVLAIRPA